MNSMLSSIKGGLKGYLKMNEKKNISFNLDAISHATSSFLNHDADNGVDYSSMSDEELLRLHNAENNKNSRWSRHSMYSYSKEEIEEMIRKAENNEVLSDEEARFLSDYYKSVYQQEHDNVSKDFQKTQEEYDKVKQVGNQYEFEKIEKNQETMKEQALLEASSYVEGYRNGTLDIGVLGISSSKLVSMSDQELKELILEKNPAVGIEYKEMMSSFQETGYESSKDFQKDYQEVKNTYETQKSYLHMIGETLKTIPYVIDQKSVKFRNYQQENIINVEGVKAIHYRESNTDGVYVDYKEYVSKYGEIDAYNFYKSAVEIYGKDVNVEGIENRDLIQKLVQAGEVDSSQGEYYTYLVETRGKDAGRKYLEAIEEGLNQVCGEIEAGEFLDSLANLNEESRVKAVTNHLGVTSKGLADGVEGFFPNIWYFVEGIFQKEENRIYSKQEYETMYLSQAFLNERTKLEAGLISESENGKKISTSSLIDYTADYGKLLNHNYQISQSIGNMLPSIGISILNPIAGSGAMGVSAGGSGYHSAMVEGYDKGDALAYGTVNGISEIAMEKLLGGIPVLSDTKVVDFKTLGKAMFSEGFEEFVQSYVEAGVGTYILKKDFDFKETTQEAIQSGIYGAITGGIMNIPSLAINSHNMKVIDSKVASGVISESEIVSAMHELIPETRDMNYKEIISEYSNPTKEFLLQLDSMNGRNVSEDVSSKLLTKIQNHIPSVSSIFDSLSILTDKANQSKNKFENALGKELNVVSTKFHEFTNFGNSLSLKLNKISASSLPKSVVEFFYLPISMFTKFKYDPVVKSSNVSNRILNEGLYHITNLESVSKIFDSGYIKASDFLTSYGSKKAFFFSGIPSLGNVATNLANVSETQVAIKIDVDESQLNQFRYRSFNDNAVVYDGDYHFDLAHASLAYLGLELNENGRLEYKEISKSEFENRRQNTKNGLFHDVSNLLKSFPIAWHNEFAILVRNLESLFQNINLEGTKAYISEKSSSLLQNALNYTSSSETLIENKVNNSNQLNHLVQDGVKAITRVTKVGVGAGGILIPFSINPFLGVATCLPSLSILADGVFGNVIKNSFLGTSNGTIDTKNGKKKTTILKQNVLAFGDIIKSRFASNPQQYFLARSLNALQYLEPNKSYGTFSQAFTLALLKKAQKMGFIENLTYKKSNNPTNLTLERLMLGVSPSNKKVQMFDILFDTTNKVLTKMDIETLLKGMDFSEFKIKTDKKGRMILDLDMNLGDYTSQVMSAIQEFFMKNKEKLLQSTASEVSHDFSSALKNMEINEAALKERFKAVVSSSVSTASDFLNSLVTRQPEMSILDLPEAAQNYIKQIQEGSDYLALKAFTDSLISGYQKGDADTKKIVSHIDVLNLSNNSFSLEDDFQPGLSKFVNESALPDGSFLKNNHMYILNEVGNGFQVMSHEMGHMLWSVIDGKSLPDNFSLVMSNIRDNWTSDSSKLESFLNEAREYKEKLWGETLKEADQHMRDTNLSFQEDLNELFQNHDELKSQLERASSIYDVSSLEVERMLTENDKETMSDLLFRYKKNQYVQDNFSYKCDNDSSMQIYDTVAGIVDSIFNGNNPYYSTIYDNGFLRGHTSDYFQKQSTNSFDEQFADFTRMKFYDMQATLSVVKELCGQEWLDMMNKKYHEIAVKMENGEIGNSQEIKLELNNLEVETLEIPEEY